MKMGLNVALIFVKSSQQTSDIFYAALHIAVFQA